MARKPGAPFSPLVLILTGALGFLTPTSWSATPEGVPGQGKSPAVASATAGGAELVPLRGLIPDLIEDVRYSTPNNFTHQVVYPCSRVFLRRAAAERLADAARYASKHYGLRLKVFDGYRPLSVQKRFWAILPDDRYVADPKTGSRHNRGAAVDLTLVDARGRDLDMGTGFDDFSARAGHGCKDFPPEVLANRRRLRTLMAAFGFDPLPSEWWHYDFHGWKAYPIEDSPLPEG